MSTICPHWRNTYSTGNIIDTNNTDNMGVQSPCGSGKKYKNRCGRNA